MLIIGLTGGFGTGKSTVARMFAARGARVLDADKIAHDLIADEGVCVKAIIKKFGKNILSGKSIDRSKLAGIVFNDPAKLKILEGIIHPQVIKETRKQLRLLAKKKCKVVVIEVPLLFESGMYRIVHRVVVVTATRAVQVARLQKRARLSKADIVKRIERQMPLSRKVYWADYVVNNSGTVVQTQKQVQLIWDKFKHVGQ